MAEPAPRLVILDRDGVINRESAEFIKSPAEWEPLPGAVAAIAALRAAGFTVVIATNQSGVGRGLFSAATLDSIHQTLRDAVRACGGEIDRIFICPHAPADACDCRKPKPGLFTQIAAAYGVTLSGVPAIGDSRRDLDAAFAAGARPILVRTGHGERTEAALGRGAGVAVFNDLAEAARDLIGEPR
ncbi:MAG: D-glycero-beta-D-manno-heptose 1,7-bisphosphate 7-phosphatase [Gammaproteobacteria bacterium]|nr:D-glycero-beta-D-manno-heptose 1,7-bisphosphate 7-phosphatase [Gammaproteobacteria bacterium]